MPGFVDVTGWTSEEVKRLGQIDDYDEPQKYQPRRTWKPRAQPQGNRYATDLVWGAACAAQRINGAYVKETQYRFDEALNTTVPTVKRNRNIMEEILDNPAMLMPEDIAQGQECRKFLQQDITFRALKGQLREFDGSVSKVLAVEDEFDSVKHKLELAVVACLPQSHARALERQAIQERVRQTTGDYVGQPGDKVRATVEIVKTNYSQQWNTWYATGITSNNQAVFFAYRSELAKGTTVDIQGTVKAHRDGATQLNRVSIM